jgi:hypothetical protein
MNDSIASLHYFMHRYVGAAGLIGIALLALAGALAWIVQPQEAEHLQKLQADYLVAKTDARKNTQRQLAAPSTVLQLRKFFEWLPPVSSNADDLQTLFALAKEANVELVKADYQITSDPNARLIRYQVILPVKERYPTIRKFSSLVLSKMPHLALDEFVVTRPQAASNVIEAQLQLTLFYRAQ